MLKESTGVGRKPDPRGVHVCVCVCLLCASVCMHVCARAYACVHMLVHVCVYVHVSAYMCMCVRVFVSSQGSEPLERGLVSSAGGE